MLAPFWVSFWICSGSPNGGQGHQKVTSKKHQKMMPKMTRHYSQRGSQNGAKIVTNDVLKTLCCKSGSQMASRAPPGSILERFWLRNGLQSSIQTRFWKGFGTILESFSSNFQIYVGWFLHTFCNNMWPTKAFKITGNPKSFRETALSAIFHCKLH